MLSTHVLDVARGLPAAGIEVALYRLDGADRALVARAETDEEGRIGAPFGGTLKPGWYELLFAAGAYLSRWKIESFYDEIPVRFLIDSSSARYHVPLLLAPYGYSTYRGS